MTNRDLAQLRRAAQGRPGLRTPHRITDCQHKIDEVYAFESRSYEPTLERCRSVVRTSRNDTNNESRAFLSFSSTSLRPFARWALPHVDALMDALTPERRFFVSLSGTMNAVLFRPGLSASCVWPSNHSVPNHLARPRGRFDTQPLSATSSRMLRAKTSPLTSRLVVRPGRNGFVNLRTSRSPPVALHLASRRRSYFQLQAGVRIPEKDLHLSDQTHLQTH